MVKKNVPEVPEMPNETIEIKEKLKKCGGAFQNEQFVAKLDRIWKI